jgi:hypothetical protein
MIDLNLCDFFTRRVTSVAKRILQDQAFAWQTTKLFLDLEPPDIERSSLCLILTRQVEVDALLYVAIRVIFPICRKIPNHCYI